MNHCFGVLCQFDLDNMKGSTMDAMSLAVDNAAVMISCISLAYKESANCRLEAQYGHYCKLPVSSLCNGHQI